MEQLQAIEKEVQQLDVARKNLSDFKDQLNEKKGERSELLLKREVGLSGLIPTIGRNLHPSSLCSA